MEPQIQRLFPEPQFARIMADPTEPVIIAARLNGHGSTTKDLGYSVFTQPIVVTARKPNGVMYTYAVNMYLVLENSTWYILSTDKPPSS
jgi:hypothetical protein